LKLPERADVYIVGTSGHIDHGKTSLIRALTGVDCDRLPEEKEREMTIDIGFASIEYPRFGTVSIIDVPGHERFIRNMIAGAWGIDLALLVVAADDGWMPQTEDHFRVLQFLGIERLIAVINKIDMVDEELTHYVEEEVREKLADTRFADAAILRVSSKTGDGIEQLREAIVVNLRRLSRAADAGKPYLFIDRVFASKGYGTVITGTLKNGMFHDDDEVRILPHNTAARIKRIESHHAALQEGSPSQRTALNLSGVSVDDLKRGYAVVRDNFFTSTSDVIAGIELLDTVQEIKNNMGVEVLIGTTAVKAKMILLEKVGARSFPARIKFEAPWFLYPGQPFVMTTPGGHRVIGGGMVLLPGFDARRQKKIVRSTVAGFETWNREKMIACILTVRMTMKRDDIYGMFPESRKALDKLLRNLSERGMIRILDEHLVTAEHHDASVDTIARAITAATGLNIKELADEASLQPDFVRLLMPDVIRAHTVIEKDGRYFSRDAVTEDALSERKKTILKRCLDAGSSGMELDKLDDGADKKELRELVKLGFLISLDGSIVYHRDIYEDLKQKIMSLFDTHEKIMVKDARDAADGLSRKYLIPLMNRIETDGLIRRLGDFRIKA
jgi:selenocysteine-specific elongation factor